jgi:hypothetical protein
MDRLDDDDGFELTTIGPKNLGLRFGVGFIANARGKFKRLRARVLVDRQHGRRRYFSFYIFAGKPLRWCGQTPPGFRRHDVEELQKFVLNNLSAINDHWEVKDSSDELIRRLRCPR